MGNLERYVQDDGRTMRNILGIERDPEAFEAALSDFTGERIAELRDDPSLVPQTFDRAHLKALHKHITGDVFEWAGTMRDETAHIEGETIGPVRTMAKPGGAQFDDASSLRSGFGVLNKLVDVEKARAMSHHAFAKHAAKIFTHINWMHPFREGNGRVQREFITQYAEVSGHELDFSCTTQGRMYEASSLSTRDDCRPMRRLLEECSDREAVARMKGPYTAFNRSVDGFQQLYFSHAHPERETVGIFRGKGANEFVVQDDATKSITVADISDLPKGAAPNVQVKFTPRTHFRSASDRPSGSIGEDISI